MKVGDYIVESIDEIAFKKNDKNLYDLYGTMILKDVSTCELHYMNFASQDFSSDSSINEMVDAVKSGHIDLTTGVETTFVFNLKKSGSAMNILFGEKYKKPPLGVRAKRFLDEERKTELKEAMLRYLDDNRAIPVEWIKEYNELKGANEIE